MEVEERDNCRACGEVLDVEHLIVTECDDILCGACMGHHDCSICGTAEDSDSDYVPSEEKSSEDETDEDLSGEEEVMSDGD